MQIIHHVNERQEQTLKSEDGRAGGRAGEREKERERVRNGEREGGDRAGRDGEKE